MYTRAHHVSSSVRNRGVREDSGHSHFKKKKGTRTITGCVNCLSCWDDRHKTIRSGPWGGKENSSKRDEDLSIAQRAIGAEDGGE
jgi:hypothetical protein